MVTRCRHWPRRPVFLSILGLSALSSIISAQEVPAPGLGSAERQADVEIVGHIDKPAELPAPDLKDLKLSEGFKIEAFARNLGNARILAVSPDGTVYVSRREQADILMLKVGPDGLAAGKPVRVAARPGMHGITFHEGKVYLATVHEIFRADVLPDGTFGPLEMIVHDLPDAGQHHTRTVQFGPDGMMYVSVGSTCNEGKEPNPENAAMLRMDADGQHRIIFASGLRDTIGWGWNPRTGEMWGMDHGIDWLGDDLQPEELNNLQKGKFYGWPYIFADNKVNPHLDPPAGSEKSDWLKIAEPMVMGYTAHAAPMQLSFYDATQFPAEYRGDAFISMRGSWNRKPPSGYEVLRIHFENGKPVRFEPFVTGFLTDRGQSGRLCGNVVAKDGSLLFTDDRNGVIYRVSYVGAASEKSPTVITPSKKAGDPQIRLPIATDTPGVRSEAKLAVSSSVYKNGGRIPDLNSAYDQNASIPVTWAPGPAETKSYALVVDDPDVPSPSPITHWIAWNIPVGTNSLHEGMENGDRPQEPRGMAQGANSMGKIGYVGPRPPAGDPPHHYHLQVFALDRELDLPLGANREALLEAMKGHVLASGDLVGIFERPAEPAKP
jgi:Raf kinase inhibitor-like YbhB/YbcL family protein